MLTHELLSCAGAGWRCPAARHLSLIEWQPQSAANWIEWWLDRQLMAGSALHFGAAAGSTLAVLALPAVPAYEFAQGYPVRRAEATFGAPLDTWRQVLKTGNLGQRMADSMNDLPENAVVIGDWEQATVFCTISRLRAGGLTWGSSIPAIVWAFMRGAAARSAGQERVCGFRMAPICRGSSRLPRAAAGNRQLADGSFEQLRDAQGNIEILGGAFNVLK